MANENVAQSHEKIVKRVSSLKSVIGAVDEREDQLYALASSLLMHLTPEDETNPPDNHPLTAWRLAQVLEDMLSSTGHRNYVRESLLQPA